MSSRAWIYLWSVVAGAIAFALFSHLTAPPSQWNGLVFGVWLVLAILAQFLEVQHGRQSYYPHLLTFFAGVVLLSPGSLTALVLIPHLAEWAKKRIDGKPTLQDWYIQPFNISAHLISALAAQHMFHACGGSLSVFSLQATFVAPILAGAVYLLINHLLIGQILNLARALSWSESGVMDLGNIFSEAVMLGIGYISALLWILGPWLILFVISPLGLIHRALRVPQLEKEAQTDAKTNLLNSRSFEKRFAEEIERAQRLGLSLSIVMADLDLLRNINNTYGHQAGDVVISEVGRILRQSIRNEDIASRFGGEEYALALPNTELENACTVAERIRQRVEATGFSIATHPAPIRVTMSFGVASYPQDGQSMEDLIYEADIALYQAKLQGRNRVVNTAQIPRSVKLAFAESQLGKHDQARPAHGNVEPSGHTGTQTGPSGNMSSVNEGETTSEVALTVRNHTRSSEPRITAMVLHQSSEMRLWLFVWGTIAVGMTSVLMSALYTPRLDLVAIGLFALLALFAQEFQVDMYERSAISVSMAGIFAAGIVGGLIGVAVASAVVAIAHYGRARSKPYKLFFNWAVHVIAGLGPVLAVYLPMRIFDLALEPRTFLWWWIPALVATGFYYLCETGLIAVAISLSEATSVSSIWNEQFRWLAQHYLVMGILGLSMVVAYHALDMAGLVVFSLPIYMMHRVQKEYVMRTENGVRELRRMNDELHQANQEIIGANETIEEVNKELFATLARTIHARDPLASGHASQAGEYAQAIAINLDLPAEQVEQIYQAGLLHDIGKLGIPEKILHKPDKLTEEEYEYVKQHAALGATFLEASHGLRCLAPFIRHHHERWDGKGYPDGMKGSEIPLEARILAVCDAVDAMASDRPYRAAMPLADILAELRRCAGSQFDPMVVEAFLQAMEEQGHQMIVNSAKEVIHAHQNCQYRIGALAKEGIAGFFA